VAATEEVSGQEQSPPSKAHASLLHAVSQRPLFSEPIWQPGAHSKAMGMVEALSAKTVSDSLSEILRVLVILGVS
jgi:hypothetical protein